MKPSYLSKSATILLASSAAVLGLCACGADASQQDDSSPTSPSSVESDTLRAPTALTNEPGRDVTKAPKVLMGAPGSLNPLPHRGGWGGSDLGDFEGGLIYAFQVVYGDFVDRITLAGYVPSNPDNMYRNGDAYFQIGPVGGPSGSYTSPWTYCPGGYVAIGIQGAAGVHLDRFGLVCGKVGNLSLQATTNMYGGPGGLWFRDQCGESQGMLGFLTGIHVRAGSWMDSEEGLCRKVGGFIIFPLP